MPTASQRLVFPNNRDQELSGRLELPASPPRAFALFAHCFTCSKDIAAATRVSRALCERSVAVLRFDFTGLGNSDGDFANTNFSSNVHDLVPEDELVDIDHARRIYAAARHPKSFVSLDGADHLLSRPGDSEYVGTVIAAWMTRYLPEETAPPPSAPGAAGSIT